MIRNIRRTPQGRRDIIAIYTYIYQRSPASADRVFDAIEKTIRGLARFPGGGNRWISDHPRLEGLRFTTITGYRSFLVFFKPSKNTVEIYRVVHGARDLGFVVAQIEP
jgi:toxin ParE1/3/4